MAAKTIHPQAPAGEAELGLPLVPYQVDGPQQRLPESPYDRSLNLAAINWLRALPQSLRPHAIPERYPRIINRLARYWNSPSMLELVFKDLLFAKRSGRKGFPPEVLGEIHALYSHFCASQAAPSVEFSDSNPDRDPGYRARQR